jgi:hypothetical protein
LIQSNETDLEEHSTTSGQRTRRSAPHTQYEVLVECS